MKKENQILIRIIKECSQECLKDVDQIISKSKSSLNRSDLSMGADSMASFTQSNINLDSSGLTKTIYTNVQNSSSSGSIKEEDDEPSYYDIAQVAKKSHIQSVMEVKHEKEETKKRSSSSSANHNLLGKLPEPTEDDSISVVGEKNKGKKKKYIKKEEESLYQHAMKKQKKESKLKVLKTYKVEENDFDEGDFKDWKRNRRHLDN